MRCAETWQATKFVLVEGTLRGDRTGSHLSVGSQLIGDLMAAQYQVALARRAKGRMLDLGCGNVPLFGVYRDLVDDVVCVDWPATLHRRQHVDAFADLAKPLPFRDSCFDTILLSDVLEHIPNPEPLIGEIARTLRPGGCVLFGVPFLYHLHEVPHDFNRYTRYQLEGVLNGAGLDVLELNEVGGSPEVLFDIMGKTMLQRPRVAATFVPVARWLLRRGFVRRLSERTRSTFPIAYVGVAQKGHRVW